jgi:uncharacterized protein (TIGR02569 family)
MDAVPPEVLAAFGIGGTPHRLAGGQGTSVVVDGLVLKPGADAEETSWLAMVCKQVDPHGFRLPAPVAATDGRLVVEGWSATTYVEGAPVDQHDRSAAAWLPVLGASRAFHRAVRHQPQPAFLHRRTHRWAVADTAAWSGQRPALGPRSARLLDLLGGLVVDEGLADQLVHADLSGNVLLSDDLAPAVIDVSPYWRPQAYADAVVVIDALLWWRADPVLVDLGRPQPLDDRIWTSLLARALTFRMLSLNEPGQKGARERDQEIDQYERVGKLLVARA